VSDDEAYALYERYITQKHADGDMYPPDREQYESFLNDSLACTQYFRLYDQDKLICIAVSDEMLDGLAAIYTFYDPDCAKRSLGNVGGAAADFACEKTQPTVCLFGILDRGLP
jgi:arginine-tRNA-protein transferase